MKNQNNIRVTISKDQRTLIVEKNGVPAFVSTNLIKYLLDLPYTRKDGSLVTIRDIQEKKSRSRLKLAADLERVEA